MKILITAVLFAVLAGTGVPAFATATAWAGQDAVTEVQAPALLLQYESRCGRDNGPNQS